ncbi:hypothetical protein WG904_15075 [Pedobacter sp. Du54]|uniref:hypothetical protein n=1 Tax=Pedobacter anseongensis TaxID=3133439 RepID=UPI00309A02A7
MKSFKINFSLTIRLFSFILVLMLITNLQKACAQLFFSNLEGSQVKISSSSNNGQFAPITTQFTCEGKFNMINGELDHLNDLKFNLPLNGKNDQGLIHTAILNTSQPKNDINFELTHAMVLPELNMIHAIGYLNIQGVRTRVNFQLNYIENNSETITIMGKRAIKLSDYKKNPISVFADKKTQDIIQLDLKLVIKNPGRVRYIAAK